MEQQPENQHPLYLWRKSRPEGLQSLAAAEEFLGVSASLLSRYERGTRFPSPRLAIRLELLTGISRAVLLPEIFGDPVDRSAA